MNHFRIIGGIYQVEIIAINRSIRELPELIAEYGPGRWRKLKGFATVLLLEDNTIGRAEVHWYEAHGIGRRKLKIKRLLE